MCWMATFNQRFIAWYWIRVTDVFQCIERVQASVTLCFTKITCKLFMFIIRRSLKSYLGQNICVDRDLNLTIFFTSNGYWPQGGTRGKLRFFNLINGWWQSFSQHHRWLSGALMISTEQKHWEILTEFRVWKWVSCTVTVLPTRGVWSVFSILHPGKTDGGRNKSVLSVFIHFPRQQWCYDSVSYVYTSK